MKTGRRKTDNQASTSSWVILAVAGAFFTLNMASICVSIRCSTRMNAASDRMDQVTDDYVAVIQDAVRMNKDHREMLERLRRHLSEMEQPAEPKIWR